MKRLAVTLALAALLAHRTQKALNDFLLEQTAIRLRAQAKPLIDRRLEHLDGQVGLDELATILALDLTNRDTTAAVIDRQLRTIAVGPTEEGPVPPSLDARLYQSALDGDPHVTVVSTTDEGQRYLTLLIPPLAWLPEPPAVIQLSVFIDEHSRIMRRLGIMTGITAAAWAVSALSKRTWHAGAVVSAAVASHYLTGKNAGMVIRVRTAASGAERGGSPKETTREMFTETMRRVEAAFLEQRLSELRMRQFLADASHELRTPLTSMSGALELIGGDKHLTADEREQMFAVIHRQVDRMARIVEGLLTITRFDSGLEVNRSMVDLTELVREHSEELRLAAPDRKQLVEVAEECFVLGDSLRLWQVLSNLTANAVRFTEPGGSIVLRLERHEKEAVIVVADDGPGISEDDQKRVFERFYSADRARTNGGVGLGLAIVRSIALAHGGWVDVEGRLGEGSTFRVGLPLAPPGRGDGLSEREPRQVSEDTGASHSKRGASRHSRSSP